MPATVDTSPCNILPRFSVRVNVYMDLGHYNLFTFTRVWGLAFHSGIEYTLDM